MMDQLFIPELKKNYEKLEKLEKNLSVDEKREKHIVFRDRADMIMELESIVNKEGLLALEVAVEDIDENGRDGYIKKLVLQLVDGTDPVLIERMAMMDFASKIKEPYESILNIITVYGLRAFQNGEPSFRLLELLNSMMPNDVAINRDQYFKISVIKEWEEKYKDIEEYCTGDIRVTNGEIGYEEISTVDAIIRRISDRGIQRLLREFDNWLLVKLLIGLSRKARKKIFDNISKRLALKIYDDLNYMIGYDDAPDWALKESKESAVIVLKVAEKLRDQGEICF